MKISREEIRNGKDGSSDWKELKVKYGKSKEHQSTTTLRVSNSDVPLPEKIDVFSEFLSNSEVSDLLAEIRQQEYTWEGFEQRRRVQRYKLSPSNDDETAIEQQRWKEIPKTLLRLVHRVVKETRFHPRFVTVEEYSPTSPIASARKDGEGVVATFESNILSQCCVKIDAGDNNSYQSNNCSNKEGHVYSYFVAYLPLNGPAIQHLNLPKRRGQAECWNLESSNHWTDIWMEQRSMFVKTKDCLFQWRHRLSALSPKHEDSDNPDDKSVVIKLHNIPVVGDKLKSETTLGVVGPANFSRRNGNDNKKHCGSDIGGFKSTGVPQAVDYDIFGHIPSDKDTIPATTPMPPLEDLLTIVITTSPVKSNPSTELIERTLDTFINGGSDFAYRCRKIFICDGFRVRKGDGQHTNNHNQNKNQHNSITRKHTNTKQAMRNGIVTPDQVENYSQFKQALKQLCDNAAECSDSPFHNATLVELSTRHGYGFALRHAVTNCVSSPYVCVIQHDRTFMRRTPIYETLRAMWYHRQVKYVTMSMRSNLMYRDIFLGKYGKMYHEEYARMMLRLPELALDASVYGPDSHSAQSMTYSSEKVRNSTQSFVENYRKSSQYLEQQEWLKSNHTTIEEGKHQLTLTPTLFWYDNTHICETAHYRDFVYNPSYKMVARGGFVEDKLSPGIIRTVERLGLQEGHSRFGCFILDDHSGLFFTGHMDGGSYLTKEKKKELLDEKRNST